MLKIKDNIELKELEKFGFHRGYNSHLKNPLFLSRGEKPDNIRISCDSRRITIDHNLWIFSGDYYNYNGEEILFNLIQAGLVEKVSDE